MERRKHQRSDVSIDVRVEASETECFGAARDISTRGIFVELMFGRLEGDIHHVKLHFEIDTGAQVLSRHIDGKVVRNEGNGLAIRFSEHDILGRAVVHELMYYMLLQQQAVSLASCTHDRLPTSCSDRVA